MKEFIPLKQLRDRVWPAAMTHNLATDMTGISLPIPRFQPGDAAHPYQVLFLLYYAVPEAEQKQPHKITRPYAWVTLDLESGVLVHTQVIIPAGEEKPLVGPGTSAALLELPNEERRMLQNLFFSRCEEAAQAYAADSLIPDQADHLVDLLDLYETLSEHPLRDDYEKYGQPFFSWLREHMKHP